MKQQNLYVVKKEVGETPLQSLERLREDHHIPAHIPMAYAGRLDPMAEGKLLVLVGDECKNIQRYWNLDKEYRVAIVLGLSSDSHDVLGRLQYSDTPPKTFTSEFLQVTLEEFVGPYNWPYPAISSKPVNGKPLFQWFLEGRLNEIEIPHSEGTIFSLSYNGVYTISPEDLKRRTREKIHSLSIVTDESKRLGRDFRRHEVIDSWNTWHKTASHPLQVLEITATVSAGTYMRTLAHEIGKRLCVGGLALEIERTKLGHYKQLGPFGFWLKQY